MDVDTDNFEEAYEEFAKHLPQAAFVGVDLEMTGITGPPYTRVSQGDVPQAQYSKGRQVISQGFKMVQVGLSLFTEVDHVERPGHFEVRPFNVYVFPRPFEERDNEGKQVKVDDHFVGLSASSMTFLSDHGLDFNRWIGKGVPYASAAIEEQLRKAIPPEGSSSSGSSANNFVNNGREKPEATKPQDIAFIKDTMKSVEEFVARGDTEMKLPGTNSFLALIMRQKIAEKYPALTIEKRPGESNPKQEDRWLVNLDEDGRKQRDEVKRRRIQGRIGFRRMWNLLKEARRPMIFHNGFFDLLFLFSSLEGQLPASLVDFKKQVNEAFPVVLDTKVLAESPDLSGSLGTSRSGLGELATGMDAHMQSLNNMTDDTGTELTKVSFICPAGFDQYTAGECSSFHTAGFDAYQTGRIFAYFRKKLGDAKTMAFINRMYLMWSAFELRLAEPTDHIYYKGVVRHLYDINTKELNNRGLSELFKPLMDGDKRKVVYKWCSNTTSLLLFVVAGNGQKEWESADRDACEKCLDALLQPQEAQKRLKFRSLEEHIAAEEVRTGCLAKENSQEDAPEAKRQRTE